MLKDRKFWTGLCMGGLIGASAMFLQPINAQNAGGGDSANVIRAITLMVKEQKITNQELKEIKNSSRQMNNNLQNFAKSQGINTGR